MKALVIILSFSFSLLCLTSHSQISIKDIKNDQDAVEFVENYGKKYNKEWGKVTTDIFDVSFVKSFKKEDRLFFDSLTEKKWIVSDFNHDGESDLIFFGKLSTHLAVLSFISQGADSISHEYIGSITSMDYPIGIAGYKMDSLNFILVKSFIRNNIQHSLRNSYRQDTLIFRFGGFVEFNPRRREILDFDSIIYLLSSPWMSFVSVPKMIIQKDGTVSLYRSNFYRRKLSTFPPENGIVIFNTGAKDIKRLQSILGYIDFLNLDGEYSIKNVFDLATATTLIYYQGNVKTISDYGMHGTYGLRLLYRVFEEIKLKSLPNSNEKY